MKLISASLLSFTLTCCISCAKEEQLNVKYINETGFELNELTIGEKAIGTLASEAQTEYIAYNKFHFDSGLPDEPAMAMIDGDSIYDFTQFYFCGTEKSSVVEGTYEFSIKLIQQGGLRYLVLE